LEIRKLITSIWKKEKLPEEWKESIILPIHEKRDKTDCSNYRGIFANHLQNFIQHPALKVNSICEGNYGGYQCGIRRNRSTIDHIFCIRQILGKKWEYNEEVHQLFIDFKKAYDSVWREVLYKILIEFGIPRKRVRLIKMSFTETHNRVRVGKNVSDKFPIRNGLNKETLYHQCFLTLL